MTEMIGTLAQLAGIGETLLWTGFVVLLRVGAAMALLPAFGELVVPQRIRLVLALSGSATTGHGLVQFRKRIGLRQPWPPWGA